MSRGPFQYRQYQYTSLFTPYVDSVSNFCIHNFSLCNLSGSVSYNNIQPRCQLLSNNGIFALLPLFAFKLLMPCHICNHKKTKFPHILSTEGETAETKTNLCSFIFDFSHGNPCFSTHYVREPPCHFGVFAKNCVAN